jgi:hypothetical protein
VKDSKISVELTKSHYWLVLKGLAMLTSAAGERLMLTEYPGIDLKGMSVDCQKLCNELDKKTPKSWMKE